MWALVIDGVVRELTPVDPIGRFHPSLEWKPCTVDVVPGWLHDGEKFIAPPPPPPLSRELIEALRLRAYADPITGSDRYFAEAQRETMRGNVAAADEANANGLARFSDIQNTYPWPAD